MPISMVYRKDKLRVDGEGMPALMEAYGAYGTPFEPSFNAGRLSLLDRCEGACPSFEACSSLPYTGAKSNTQAVCPI